MGRVYNIFIAVFCSIGTFCSVFTMFYLIERSILLQVHSCLGTECFLIYATLGLTSSTLATIGAYLATCFGDNRNTYTSGIIASIITFNRFKTFINNPGNYDTLSGAVVSTFTGNHTLPRRDDGLT